MISPQFAFSEIDLAEWINHPCWGWFKELCRNEARLKAEAVASLNPLVAAYEMAVAQGERNIFRYISEGVPTAQGILSFERYLLERYQEITKNENVVDV